MTTDSKSPPIPSSFTNLIINLVLILLWLLAAGGFILGRLNIAGRSGFIGVLLGLTFTWLILSPIIHQSIHRRILSSRESDQRQQVLTNLRFALLFTIAAVIASVVFALLHQTFLVVMK